MTEHFTNDDLDQQAVAEFAVRLAAFASQLSPRDRLALSTIVLRAMEPLERMRWRDASQVLSPNEEAVLRRLLDVA